MSDFNDYENETIIKTAKSFYELVRKFKIYKIYGNFLKNSGY